MQSLETIMTSWIESYMQDVYTCMPAIVINVKNMGELRVDVQPVINHMFKDGTLLEYPPIGNVPLIFPSTKQSAVTMPVEQGDTVLLMFSQKDMSIFKAGADRPHDPNTRRWMNLNDAVAIVGVHPFSKSPNRNAARKLPHSTDDLVVAHNIGTDRECEVRLSKSGSIAATSLTEINLNAPIVKVAGNLLVAGTASFASPTIFTAPVSLVGGTQMTGDVQMTGSKLTQSFAEIETTAGIVKTSGVEYKQTFGTATYSGLLTKFETPVIQVESTMEVTGNLVVNKSDYTTHIHAFVAAGSVGISSPPIAED